MILRGLIIGLLLALLGLEAAAEASEQPNIVLIAAEDMSARVGAFGDSVARTPHIDRLAAEGVRYTQVFFSHRCLRA